MKNTTAAASAHQLITDRLVSMLEQGTIPWRKPWAGSQGLPKNLISRKAYSGINTWMLHCSNYGSSYFLTFKQALELGGNVRKGEKGHMVVFSKQMMLKTVEVETEGRKETMIDGRTGKRMLKKYYVFNVEQCEGIEIPDAGTRHEHDPIEAAESIIAGMPNRPEIQHGGGKACYIPTRDRIELPEASRFEKRAEYYATAFHEMAHSTGHASRLGRDLGGTFGSDPYAREELIAEMSSAYLCAAAGIETATLDNQAAYLAGWIQALKGDSRLAIQAASAAQKAADYILNKAAA